jgi:F-type H+-transporting ATPase subunit gamma
MSDLKQLRNRVKSIKSTQKITKAMHVVSASKLKKIKEQAEKLNLYSEVLSDIMYDISTGSNLSSLPKKDLMFFSEKLEEKPYLFLVMTSERGLCGAFNSSILRKVKKDIRAFQKEGAEVKLLVIGKKGMDSLRDKYAKLVEEYYPNPKGNIACMSRIVKDKVIDMVEKGEAGVCYIYYNKFKNVLTQIVTRRKILPASHTANKEVTTISEYEYEGSDLVHEVINLYIRGQVNYSLLQNKASEEGARMTAMDNATRNASELVDKLTLKLNRSRQAIITTELTEIISGAEVV